MTFNEGACRTGARWCRWKVLHSDGEYQLEYCLYCKKTAHYKTVNGRIDNTRYLRAHIRDFCQPFGSTSQIYRQIYGAKAIMKLTEHDRDLAKRRREMEGMDKEYDLYMNNKNRTYHI